MHSLSAHLRSPTDHGGLAFHPECPVCRRERLVGVLPSEPIVSRRAQAVFASGVLAISAASPAAVLAAEPDREQQGSLAPDQVAGAGPSEGTAYDPGGGSTDLPLDDRGALRPPSPGEGTDGAGTLDEEPLGDSGAPIVDAGDEGDGSAALPEALASPQPDPSPSASPEQPAAPSEPVTGAPEAGAAPAPPTRKAERPRTQRPHRSASAKQSDPVTLSAPLASGHGTTVGSPQAAVLKQTTVSPADRATRTDRFHVVHSGESLWSIAGDRLGGERSPARIAREVSRLWELNKERIGTGDPDLLLVGTKLRLR
jgi:hypothetical protein